MDAHDLILALWVMGVLACVTLIGYALDDLYQRRKVDDDIDRELRELIGEDK